MQDRILIYQSHTRCLKINILVITTYSTESPSTSKYSYIILCLSVKWSTYNLNMTAFNIQVSSGTYVFVFNGVLWVPFACYFYGQWKALVRCFRTFKSHINTIENKQKIRGDILSVLHGYSIQVKTKMRGR